MNVYNRRPYLLRSSRLLRIPEGGAKGGAGLGLEQYRLYVGVYL